MASHGVSLCHDTIVFHFLDYLSNKQVRPLGQLMLKVGSFLSPALNKIVDQVSQMFK